MVQNEENGAEESGLKSLSRLHCTLLFGECAAENESRIKTCIFHH